MDLTKEQNVVNNSACDQSDGEYDVVLASLDRGLDFASSSMHEHSPQSFRSSAQKLQRSSSSDFPSTTTPSLRMVDVGLLMREQDADLLESIHQNGPNKTGTTPVLTSRAMLSDALVRDAPLLSSFSLLRENTASADEEANITPLLARTPPSPIGKKERNQLIPYLIPPTTNSGRSLLQPSNDFPCNNSSSRRKMVTAFDSITSNGISTSPPYDGQDETSATPPSLAVRVERPINRRMLSGEIFQREHACEFVKSPTVDTSEEIGNVGPSCTVSATIEGVDLSLVSSGAKHEEPSLITLKRCESKERRMNEAAQFAEIVGDLPLTEQKSMRIIDYPDDDDHAMIDDDDDDATEVHVQKRVMMCGGALILPKNEVVKLDASAVVDGASVSSAVVDAVVPPPLTSSTSDKSLLAPETPVKSRPQWPVDEFHHQVAHKYNSRNSDARNNLREGFLTQLPSSLPSLVNDFVYKGIRSNPPDIVKRGTTRGNYALLHRKAWLEVSDKYHRYGKNLRLYYRFWESLGCPTNMFFDWLDSKGEAAGQPLPELSECPRCQLDSDTVLYITNMEVTQGYALRFEVDEKENDEATSASASDGGSSNVELRRGRVVDVDGDPVCTGPNGWIFVLRDNVMYGAAKITSVSGQSKQRFHHSSFFGGKAVAAAGIFITDDHGYLTKLYPHSGHYRPGEAHMQRVLFYIYHEGVDLCSFEIDTQQIVHVARESDAGAKDKEKNDKMITIVEGKKKKIESLHLMPAVLVACFLAHKARFIGEGVFSRIHQIRKTDVASVTEALLVIDNGGFWPKKTSTPCHETQ